MNLRLNIGSYEFVEIASSGMPIAKFRPVSNDLFILEQQSHQAQKVLDYVSKTLQTPKSYITIIPVHDLAEAK